MLKRHQVLLNDWLADFIKHRAALYDISFSECIRLALCLYFSNMLPIQKPGFKPEMTIEKMAKLIAQHKNTPQAEEERHKAISKAYFEARKAIEYYMKEVKSSPEKN